MAIPVKLSTVSPNRPKSLKPHEPSILQPKKAALPLQYKILMLICPLLSRGVLGFAPSIHPGFYVTWQPGPSYIASEYIGLGFNE